MEQEDKSCGGITWHSSEEDGGPDVGISVFLGGGKRLYCGEISRKLYDDENGDANFDGDGGWFLVLYDPAPRLIAKMGERQHSHDLMELIGWAARDMGASTVAKYLGGFGRG